MSEENVVWCTLMGVLISVTSCGVCSYNQIDTNQIVGEREALKVVMPCDASVNRNYVRVGTRDWVCIGKEWKVAE